MKKAILLVFSILLFGSMMSSCKSKERCPAYSKVDPQSKVEKAA